MAKRGVERVLASVPLFEDLAPRHLKRIRDITELADYMAGASIVKEGADGDSFFVILRGQAKVAVKGRTINRLRPGDHFGEISLLDGGKRSASVVSETPMTLAIIQRDAFMKIVRQEPTIASKILKELASRIRMVDRSLAG